MKMIVLILNTLIMVVFFSSSEESENDDDLIQGENSSKNTNSEKIVPLNDSAYNNSLLKSKFFNDHSNKEALKVSTVKKGNLKGSQLEYFLKENIIIKDKVCWIEFLELINKASNKTDEFLSSEIDFYTNSIIAVIDSEYTTNGFHLKLNVTLKRDTIFVNINRKPPNFDDLLTITPTQPFHIIQISNSELPIVFIEE